MSDQDWINELARRFRPTPENNGHGGAARNFKPSPPRSDDEVIAMCREAKNAAKFARLFYEGDTSAHGGGDPSDSAADFALLGILQYYTQDNEQLARLMRASELYRPEKWDKRHTGATQLDYSIRRSLAKLEEEGGDTWQPDDGARLGRDDREDLVCAPKENPLLAGLVNLADAIEHGIEPPEELEPGILLKGMVHHIFAPAGVGKTFLALWLAARRLERGEKILYFDSENGKRIVAERLEQIGAPMEAIREHFAYLPFASLDLSPKTIENYHALIDEVDPTLVIFDSWIKFLSAAGLDEDSNDDVAKWSALFLQPLRVAQRTSLVLDHVPHDGNRSRGASRKRDEVDVQWSLQLLAHFNRATTGEIKLELKKDREGWLPEFHTFTIGGTPDGFVFGRKYGGGESPGFIAIKERERKAFDILVKEFGDGGAKHNRWKNACVPKHMSKSSFDRSRDELIRVRLVRKEDDPSGPTYYPNTHNGGFTPDPPVNPPGEPTFGASSSSRGFRGGEPDLSPQIWEMPDRVQEGSNRVHEPDGPPAGSQGSHPLRGEPVNPVHEPSASVDKNRCFHGDVGGCNLCRKNRLSDFYEGAKQTCVVQAPQGCDVYIGREVRDRKTNKVRYDESEWHNPYLMDTPKKKRDGTREEVIAKYERYLREDRPDLMARLHELKGKVLGCWCTPDPCHGDVLLRLINEKEE